MRVASATGSPLNADSDLMREIASALRGGQHEPTVVQAIMTMRAEITSRLDTMIRQGGGQAAGAPPPGRGGPGNFGTGSPDDPFLRFTQNMDRLFMQIERGVNTGFGGGHHGHGQGNYFGHTTFISTLGEADRLLRAWTDPLRQTPNPATWLQSFTRLFTLQVDNSVRGFVSSILNTGLKLTNLGEAFGRLTTKIGATVADYRSEVLGSNILTPGEHFLEFWNRLSSGILTATDSFRTVMKTVQDQDKANMETLLTATGRSVRELAGDVVQMRGQVRARGVDMLGLGTAGQTEKWLANIVDTMQRFGIKTDLNNASTADRAYTMLSELMRIRSNTGSSVDKLQELVKKAADEQAELVGSGRLNAQEALGLSQVVGGLRDTFKKDAEPIVQLLYKTLAAARPESGPGAVMASDKSFIRLESAARGLISNVQATLSAAMQSGNTNQVVAMIQRWEPLLRNYEALNRNNDVVANTAYGEQRAQLAGIQNFINRVNTAGIPTADQQSRGAPSALGAWINTQMTRWEEFFKPAFRGLEVNIAANTAAVIGLTTMLLRTNTMIGSLIAANSGGLMGTIGRAARGVGAVTAGAGLVAGSFQTAGDFASGNTGAGVGGVAGGAAGMMVGRAVGGLTSWFSGPFGILLGGVIGQQLGRMVGEMISPQQDTERAAQGATIAANQAVAGQNMSAGVLGRIADATGTSVAYLAQLAGDRSMAGPGAPNMAALNQTAQSQESTVDILSRVLNSNETQNEWLSQIKGELARQTTYLTGKPSPAGAPAVGFGLQAGNVSSISAGRGDSSYPWNGQY